MTIDIVDEIKARVKLEDEIAKIFTLTGKGKALSTKEHDSLKIRCDWQRWRWYSTAWRSFGSGDRDHGDVFDWYMLAHRCDFRTALEDLARQAGVELRTLTAEEQKARDVQRAHLEILEMAARYYQTLLWSPVGEAGLAYCRSRMWSDETIERERIGYVPRAQDWEVSLGNKALSSGMSDEESKTLYRQLSEAGLVEHPTAKAVLSIPQGHIVYVHRRRGQVIYLSGRGIEAKRHYNLPEELSGGKMPYENDPDGVTRRGVRVAVEGQADAISLAQYGIQAVALCGLVSAAPLGTISHVALDNDEEGMAKALEVALGADPLTCVVTWPDKLTSATSGAGSVAVKDANDLLKSNWSGQQLAKLLEDAPIALVELAKKAGKCKDKEERQALIDRLCALYTGLDEIVAADLTSELGKYLGGVGQLKRIVGAYKQRQEEKEKPSGGGRCEYSAGGACAGTVWEQCIAWAGDGRGMTEFAVRLPNGEIRYQKSLDVGDVTYIPYPADLGLLRARRVVLFPEKAEEYGSEKELNQEIRSFIHDFLDIDPFYEKLASYYVMFSWLYDMFENLPYLRALGDYGTGKTRFIQTIGVLCYRPMLVSGASTTSPIFNIIDMFNGTLVIDEADFSNSDADNEIIKILNIGYYKGGVVLRAEKDPTSETYIPNARDVYGPKILATRKLFVDRATESRCLTKRMSTARPRPGIPYTLGTEFWGRAQAIRNKLLMYRLRNHRPIEIDHSLADMSIEPRLNQVTLPLLTLIQDGQMRSEIVGFVKAYNEILISDRRLTLPAIVVQVLANVQKFPQITVFGAVRDFSMKGIAEKVQEILNDVDPETRVNANKISKCLSEELGLVRREKDGKNRRDVLIFEPEELDALMARYGIEAVPMVES